MIDKELVKKRFSRSLKTYNDNAIVQKHMAEKLISLLPRKDFNSIFEIGAGTGLLTREIKNQLKFNEYACCDIIAETEKYINEIIPENTFISGDIDEIAINKKYDLIISNAALQWCSDLEKMLDKLKLSLNTNGVLAVSVFGNGNFKELKTVLNLPDIMKTNLTGIEETITLYFDSPLDVLKHIKASGANALTKFKFTKTALHNFEMRYKELFSLQNKVFLTYNPLYLTVY